MKRSELIENITDNEILGLLIDIDTLATDYNHYDYGLPIGLKDKEDIPINDKMIELVRVWLNEQLTSLD